MTGARQRVLLVGASGIIGRFVHSALLAEFEVITAGLEGADLVMDLSQVASIEQGLQQAGLLNAIVCTAGRAHFAPAHRCRAAGLMRSQAVGRRARCFLTY